MKNITNVKFKEGIDRYKFMANFQTANAQKVYDLFLKYGYDLELDGRSVKVFTIPSKAVYFHDNEPELTISQLEESLIKIKELGLEDIFSKNISLNSLKPAFVARVEWCINNNLPFIDEEQKFLKHLNNAQNFAYYSTQIPLEEVKTVQQVEKMEEMDAEDRQVYNQIVENLNYLILQNPTNEDLHKIVNNIIKNVVGSILRKEYKFLPLTDIIHGVMFEGIEVTSNMENMTDLILNAFPEVMNKEERRGLA